MPRLAGPRTGPHCPVLLKEDHGDRWLAPDLFRFAASARLGDIEHHVTGAYSAGDRHPVG